MTDTGKVLIINDAPGVSNRVIQWLVRKRYWYVLVDSAEEAQELLQRHTFDAVIHAHELLIPAGALLAHLTQKSKARPDKKNDLI